MRELDLVFNCYLHERYPCVSADEQAGFRQVIDAEDADVYAWLMGYARVPDGPLASIILCMRELLCQSIGSQSEAPQVQPNTRQ